MLYADDTARLDEAAIDASVFDAPDIDLSIHEQNSAGVFSDSDLPATESVVADLPVVGDVATSSVAVKPEGAVKQDSYVAGSVPVSDIVLRESETWPVQANSRPANLFRRVLARVVRFFKLIPERIKRRRS